MAVTNSYEEMLECLLRLPLPQQQKKMVEYLHNDQTIVQTVMDERNEDMLSLMCESGDHYMESSLEDWRDDEGNSILHLAAKMAPPHILNSISGGAAFQIRQDLIWFKKVDSMIQPRGRLTNRNKDTAQHMFRKEHQGLLKEGENWMKNTAAVWMKVGTLITAIILLSIVISALGGANSSRHENPFVIFVVSLALISSFTSVVMFYSIVLSFYGEEEFLTSLPLKLVFGHATLCFSLAMMLVAYTVQLNMVIGNEVYGVQLCAAILVFLALVLAVAFTFSQVKLLIQMFCFTYWRTG